MRSKLLVAAIALVVAVAVVAWFMRGSKPSATQQAAARSTPSGPTPQIAGPNETARSQQELESEIITKGVTPERAKLLFSMVVGPLPGVAMPPTIARDPREFDGTAAIQFLSYVWNDLTAEQQHAAAVLINRPEKAPQSTALQIPRLVLATFLPAMENDTPAYDYGKLLSEADGTLAALLNVPGVKFSFDIDYGPITGTEYAHTWSWWRVSKYLPVFNEWKANPGNGCNVTIHNQKFLPINATDAQAIMTHEMMHCFQQRQVATGEAFEGVHVWLSEGEATWAMAVVVPGVRDVIEKYWNMYAAFPQTLYSARGYDGIGIYGHMSDVAGDSIVWSKLLPLMTDGIGGDDLGAFNDLIAGNEQAYFRSWGSSYFLAQGQRPWTMSGPAHPPDSGIAPDSLPMDGDTTRQLDVPSYQAKIATLGGSADIVGIRLLLGYGRAHDPGFDLDTVLDSSGTLMLCVKQGGCRCPDGTPGAALFTQVAHSPISLGIEGGDTSASVLLIGASLDSFCKEPDKNDQPPPPPGGGGGGGGGDGGEPPAEKRPDPGTSQGDTHITTFDGLKYDFQVVGEYTLVKSTRDDFAIQVRQVPVLKSKTVSVNQAVATKIGAQRATVTIENNAPVLRVDGKVAVEPAIKLDAGTITRAPTMYGTTFLLSWRDGTTARVEQLGTRVLNVTVRPAQARRGALAGLLGDWDGTPENDLIAVGARLGLTPAAKDINHALADAWRIPQTASFFDYQPGQTSATFSDPSFPDSIVDASNVPDRATAEQKCRVSGITDRKLLDSCILDYALTSDFLFASAYRHEQQVLAAQMAAPGPPRSGVLRSLLMAGTNTDPKTAPHAQFTASAGDILWVGNPDCTDLHIEVGLVDPSGKGITGGWPCAIGRKVLTATGTYTLRGYRTTNATGAYHVPINVVRPDHVRTIKYGQAAAGRIETPGVHDVFTFDAKAGDVVRISGEGCDVPLVVGIVDPNGHDFLGPGCRSGTDTVLRMDGKYQLVINATDSATGVYHFVFRGAPSQPSGR
jgi:von Willebrand factor type D domain